jgi:methionine sulfoxide reductase heme-binding subunit
MFLLRSRPILLRRWRLFWTLAIVISIAIALKLPAVDLRTDLGWLLMIQRAVKCALPFFVVAISASSLAQLFPSAFTRWLLGNRRYIGLAFAFGMGVHFSLILWLVGPRGFRGLHLVPTVIDLIGAAFLAAMTITSFPRLSRWLSASGWRRLHKTGVYVIWSVAVYVYVLGLPQLHGWKEFAPLIGLLAAMTLRMTAWVQQRLPGRSVAAARDD